MLTVVCGLGHVAKFNLVTIPKGMVDGYRCHEEGCSHGYLAHVVDDKFEVPTE